MSLEILSDNEESAPTRIPVGLKILLAVDLVLFAILPAILEVVSSMALTKPLLAINFWYSPLNLYLYAGWWPVVLCSTPIFNVLIFVAVLHAGKLRDYGRIGLLWLIGIQNVLSVIGVAFSNRDQFLALWSSRTIFSLIMIGINVWYFTRPRIARLFQKDGSTVER